jgi:CheY-like chemotaxis protein
MSAKGTPILLVEDDPNDVLLFRRALRRAEASAPVVVAQDGDEAVRYLSGGDGAPHPGLVILDLKLPRRSGLEVLEWIRGQPEIRRLPVIFLTSSRQPRDIEAAYELGANSYLVKPVDFDDLLEMVRTLLSYWIGLNELPRVGHG